MSKALGGLSPSKGWWGFRKSLKKITGEELTDMMNKEKSRHVKSLIKAELKRRGK